MYYIAVFIFLIIIRQPVKAIDECPTKCSCQTNMVICSLMNFHEIPPNLPSNLTMLDLRYNKIEELTEDSFFNFTELVTLLLSNNEIKHLPEKLFKNQIKLRTLHLHKNKIKVIENGVFQYAQNLQTLFLHDNNLKTISLDFFSNIFQLQNLRLDNNPLQCDCELFWFIQTLLDARKNTKTLLSGVCNEPASLKGKTLFDLEEKLFSSEINDCRHPRFVSVPEDTKATKEGVSVFMRCRAKGYKLSSITWKKDGIDIDYKNKNYRFLPDSLQIESVSHNDEGIYECIASNNVGSIKSKPASLKIKTKDAKLKSDLPPRKIIGTVSPSTLILSEGNSAQIDCSVEEKPSDISVIWLKNNFALREIQSKLKILNNGSLILSNVEIGDSGKYDCIITEPITATFGSCEIIVNAAPSIISFPGNLAIGAGATVEIQCPTIGHPIPVIMWFKNGNSIQPTSRLTIKNAGNTLSIEKAEESDTGMYTCLAQNVIGSAEANTEIRVKNHGDRVPRIIIKPFDIDVPQFSSIEIPCKSDGEPLPLIQWLKNNEPLRANDHKFRISNISLRIYKIDISDSGVYTCIVSNIYGNDSASGTVTVIGNFHSKNDEFIMQAYHDAKLEIDRAINATINHVFAQRNNSKSPDFLTKIFRYPDEFARNILKPADLYGRTLVNVRKHILSGVKLNISDEFIYKEILTPVQLQLIANLSGCVPHLLVTNCSNVEFHSKYATLDGSCNNLQNPMWGSSYTAFRRILKPIYENGFNTPIGWNKDRKYYGYPKPQARLVSTSILRTYNITLDEDITHMVMQWGQFLDHDLDHALPSTTAESWEGLDCKKTCAYSEPCFPMEVPHNDSRIKDRRCMDFIRSSAVCGSDITSVFFSDLHPREQLNQLTSYIDASQVYGFTRDRSFLLRELRSDLGLLRGGISSEHDKLYLPTAGQNEVDCRRDLIESTTGCFLAGDIRVNEQVGLLAIQTIWFREHNRLAMELKKVNEHWNGDTLYYEARRILIAEMQHITYEHWLPLIIGKKGMRIIGTYIGYDSNIDATISNVFATAALRMGHTLINPQLARLNKDFKTIPQGNLSLGKAFFSPWRLVEEGGVDPLMRGFFVTPSKIKKPNQNLNDELTDKLFTAAHAVSLDLAAMNIQRSRDHGLPGYLEYRKFCNLSIPQTFDDLKNDIKSADVRIKLKALYGHPGNIDVFVGGILEDALPDAKVGPLFICLLAEQFKRLRDADRFWYENPQVYTAAQLKEIKRITLSRVLCDNGDNIEKITKNVFILPQLQNPKFVDCSEIPKINFEKWRNCGAGCTSQSM